MVTRDATLNYREGRRLLASHEPVPAVRALRAAVDGTRASDPRLGTYLYWFAVGLLRLGRPELAAKSLASAQKLQPRSFARIMYRRLVNEYGMIKTETRTHDDFKAFCSIQMSRYFRRRGRRYFISLDEREAVIRLIVDGWNGLAPTLAAAAWSCAERLAAFERFDINWPALLVSSGAVIQADFRAGRRLSPDDRCRCGSGLPFRLCCGRTQTPLEACTE